jgi:orotate phosphoribosyltransferase
MEKNPGFALAMLKKQGFISPSSENIESMGKRLSLLRALLEREVICPTKLFPLKNYETKVPMGLFFQKLLNLPNLLHELAEIIADNMPDGITCIACLGYEGQALGMELRRVLSSAQYSVKLCALVSENEKICGFHSSRPLENEQVLLVTGVIAAGMNTAHGLELIRTSGGMCKNVISIFDYGFHLKRQNVFQQIGTSTAVERETVSVQSLFTFTMVKDFIEEDRTLGMSQEAIRRWIHSDGKNIFRQEIKMIGLSNEESLV